MKVFLAGDVEIGKILFFRGEQLEKLARYYSYVKENKYLRKGCQWLLSSVV